MQSLSIQQGTLLLIDRRIDGRRRRRFVKINKWLAIKAFSRWIHDDSAA